MFSLRRRVGWVLLASCLSMVTVLFRLAAIQIAGSRALSIAATEQRAMSVPLETARGRVLDRNGVPLTESRIFNAVIFPQAGAGGERAAREVGHALGLDPDAIRLKMSSATPVTVKEGLSPSDIRAMAAIRSPGVFVAEERMRYSPDSIARHVVGYTGAGGEGLAGIEKAYDRELRGEAPGALSLLVDAAGRPLEGLAYRLKGAAGADRRRDVVLTIDGGIQAVCERVLDERFAWEGEAACKGAAVVLLDARTGEVLAMASRPDFDQGSVSRFIDDARSPLLNRAVAAYAPGSVFKIVTAAAALGEAPALADERFRCNGAIEAGSLRFECATGGAGGHGLIDLRTALAVSCNVAMIQVGERVGAEALVSCARAFGFGKETGGVPGGESAGIVPDPSRGVGDTANMSIGQGNLAATPLQVAQAMTAVVNGGRMLPATVVKEIRTPGGRVVRTFPRPAPVRSVSPSTAAWLRQALMDATRKGSAAAAWVEGRGSGGKTGSAETGRKAGPRNILHSWFVGFAPAFAPKFVCCVFVEDGGYGGTVAAPAFRAIMKEILR